MADAMELLAAPFETGELDAPGPGGLTVLRARPGGPFPSDALVCEQGFRPAHDALAAEGREVSARLEAAPESAPMAAVALVRAKAENRANFARAWAMTRPGGWVLAAGPKTDGVESLQKDLRKLGFALQAMPRRHGRVIWVERAARAPEAAEAAFADWIAEAAPRPRVEGPDGRRFVTAAGGFCWDRVDAGSRLLVEAMPEVSGAVADLGAGWGYLGAAVLARPEVTRLDSVEAELCALDAARANLDDPRAVFHWADATRDPLPAGGHDWVIANPPFHAGREVSLSLGESFLRAAARLLRPGGRLALVANRTLAYERVLETLFAEVGEAARDSGYKVLTAARPRPSAAAGPSAGRGGVPPRGRGAGR